MTTYSHTHQHSNCIGKHGEYAEVDDLSAAATRQKPENINYRVSDYADGLTGRTLLTDTIDTIILKFLQDYYHINIMAP